MASFDDMCDIVCFHYVSWPKDMQNIRKQVVRAYVKLYSRWDVPTNDITIIAIEIWKRGGDTSDLCEILQKTFQPLHFIRCHFAHHIQT